MPASINYKKNTHRGWILSPPWPDAKPAMTRCQAHRGDPLVVRPDTEPNASHSPSSLCPPLVAADPDSMPNLLSMADICDTMSMTINKRTGQRGQPWGWTRRRGRLCPHCGIENDVAPPSGVKDGFTNPDGVEEEIALYCNVWALMWDQFLVFSVHDIDLPSLFS